MNCRNVEKWIWQEGAGNLPSAAIEHASGCPDCRTLIEQVRLLDRSVGASFVPDPGDVYWEAMRERISRRLDQPVDHVVELVPRVVGWRRILAHAWAPTMAVVLLAVIASQRTLVAPPVQSGDTDELTDQVSKKSSSSFAAHQGVARPEESSTFQPSTPSGSGGLTAGERARSISKPATHARAAAPTSQELAKSESSALSGITVPQSRYSDAVLDQPKSTEPESLWPERQVTIMGEVDSNSPNEPSIDERRLAVQDPFGAYERQMALQEQGLESVSTFATPGRLMEAPPALLSRGSERLTPAEQMRRFDEIAELHDLIARLEGVPASSRAMSQWTQWTTAWYRLGMLSEQSLVLDSAITAVGFFQTTVPVDSVTAAEWQVRRTHLENRRAVIQQ